MRRSMGDIAELGMDSKPPCYSSFCHLQDFCSTTRKVLVLAAKSESGLLEVGMEKMLMRGQTFLARHAP